MRSVRIAEQSKARHFHCEYVLDPGGRKSALLNSGLTQVRGDIVILTDDDVRPTPGWLHELTKPITAGTLDAVSGRVTIAPHLQRSWMKPVHLAWLAATDYLDPTSPGAAVGANMAFARRVLDRVPAFDPELRPGRLGLWEDTLFSMQLVKAGYRLGMATAAHVEHHFEPSRLNRAAFVSRARSEGRSSAYVAWHWRHEFRSPPFWRLGKWHLHLLAKRATRWSDWHQPEGMAEWEINLITGIEFEQHFRAESRRKRVYQKFALAKA